MVREEKNRFLCYADLKLTKEWEDFLKTEERFLLADKAAYERLSYLENLFSLDEFEVCYLHVLLLPKICMGFQAFFNWLEHGDFPLSFSFVCVSILRLAGILPDMHG